MKYLPCAVEMDKKVMLDYIRGNYSASYARKLISENNCCEMTMKEFYEATWKWGYVPRHIAENNYREYLIREEEKNGM